MKRYIFILLIFPIFLCYGQAHTDNEEPYENIVEELYEYIVNKIRQYISANNLPIIINNDDDNLYNLHILNNFEFNDKIDFFVYLENLVSIAHDNLRTDEMIIVYYIRNIFYNECVKNNYEIPFIIHNYNNECKLLIDFLRVNNFYISYYYNNIIYFNIEKNISMLDDFMNFLYEAINISKENILNFYKHGPSNYDPFLYKKIVFNEYGMKTIDLIDDLNNGRREDLFSLWEEDSILVYCYNYYIWLFTCLQLNGFEYQEYNYTVNEIMEGYINHKKWVDEWYVLLRNNKNK